MDGARHTILQLEVHLRYCVLWEDRSVRNVTYSQQSCVSTFLINSTPPLNREIVIRIAADSTIFRIVNLLIALSLGVHREQFEHRTGLTWPRPFLFRPLFARFFTILAI